MQASNTRSLKVFSYNCCGFDYPENTVRALRAACRSDVDGIFLDIRLTKDGKWVVPHTETRAAVLRMHTQSLGKLREVTPLDTVLALWSAIAPNKRLFLAAKDTGKERELAQLLPDTVVLTSWDPVFLQRFHAIAPTVLLGLSYAPRKSTADVHVTTRTGTRLVYDTMQSFTAGMQFGKTQHAYLTNLPPVPLYCVQVHGLFCSSKLVQLAHDHGIKLYAFLVDAKLPASLLAKRGVDGILTRTPTLFLQ